MFQGGSLWAGVISGGISQVQDTQFLNKGQMDGKEYAVKTTGNVTSAVGIMAGVEYGAVWGTSVFPGIGTAVGAVVGGLLGDRVGRVIGHQAGNMMFNNGGLQNLLRPTMQSPAQENTEMQ